MAFYSLSFSATGRTRAVADLLTQAWGEPFSSIDLSSPTWTAPAPFTDQDICLVAVPAYGGRVPAPAAERLRTMKGNGAQAILVATFGNRAIDDTLRELEVILTTRGFGCRAAMEVVTSHSIVPQVAADRPDEADRAQLADFVRQIREGLSTGTLPQVVTVPGSIPDKPGHSLPVHPKGDHHCTKCGLCASQCPVGAIPADDPTVTSKDQCISCMRCIAICPQQARSLPALMVAGISTAMGKAFAGRKPNTLYI